MVKTAVLSVWRIALWALGLNVAWELAQCLLFYDMAGWGFWRSTAFMWGAILGDVLIVLGIAYAAKVVVGKGHITPPDEWGWLVLLLFGFVTSIVLEGAAQALDLWHYSALMPTVHIGGHAVGLSPIIQVTFLPALSVWLASHTGPHRRR